MPREIEEIFQKAGAPLIPSSETDISSDCSCPDVDDTCKHIAAVYYVLGQEIDRDPFLLMEMRGLGRAQLLTEIQGRRNKKPIATPSPERPLKTFLSDHLNDFFPSAERHVRSRGPLKRIISNNSSNPADEFMKWELPPFGKATTISRKC